MFTRWFTFMVCGAWVVLMINEGQRDNVGQSLRLPSLEKTQLMTPTPISLRPWNEKCRSWWIRPAHKLVGLSSCCLAVEWKPLTLLCQNRPTLLSTHTWNCYSFVNSLFWWNNINLLPWELRGFHPSWVSRPSFSLQPSSFGFWCRCLGNRWAVDARNWDCHTSRQEHNWKTLQSGY